MGLGNYPFEVLFQIQGITSHQLERFTTEQIFKSFSGVAKALADFKLNHPDKVPMRTNGGGLLNMDMGQIPVNDFELAQHLISTNEPEMVKVINESQGVPVLMAYLEVLINGKDLPDEFMLTSALPYAVSTRTFEGDVAELWNLELTEQASATAKRVRERNVVNASKPRPNARAIDHDEVKLEYSRLVRDGHTEREARGILVQRGNMGSQTTIYRITKEK